MTKAAHPERQTKFTRATFRAPGLANSIWRQAAGPVMMRH
jgi:hypothetical protein